MREYGILVTQVPSLHLGSSKNNGREFIRRQCPELVYLHMLLACSASLEQVLIFLSVPPTL